MGISFAWRNKKETDEELFEKFPSIGAFIDKHYQACLADFQYKKRGVVVAVIASQRSLFYSISDWVQNKSEGSIKIKVLKEEEGQIGSQMIMFRLEVSDAYTPLSRYIAFYLALVTLRMSDYYEGFFRGLEGNYENFSGHKYHLLNNFGCRYNSNHCAFTMWSGDSGYLSLPIEVYDRLFAVEVFNNAFKESFSEMAYKFLLHPVEVSLEEKVSQTACLLKLCEYLGLEKPSFKRSP